jgi:lipopolysaccharide transport system ATP-binding protein
VNPSISFECVSKKFTLHRQQVRSFQESALDLFRREEDTPISQPAEELWEDSREEFWALRDVSFTVERGETVGIIGPNGAGKSTVLKLVTRIIEPTSGQIEVSGRVGALLELGAGFHPDLTGRENIYLNGSILRLGRAEIDQKMDEIIAFAELERFIDIPLKHYSSGMKMRLGFAVAANIEPEILLIDEVLAVGDQNFQAKCLEKIAALRRDGVTILLVSHNLDKVQELCEWVGWLEHGALEMYDVAEPVIAAYLRQTSEIEKARTEEDNVERSRRLRYGDGAIRIAEVEMVGEDGQTRWDFQSCERVRVRLHYEAASLVETPIFSALIHREDGLYVSGVNTYQEEAGSELPAIEGHNYVELEFESLQLARGVYLLSVGAYEAPDPPFWANPADFHDRAYRFFVESDQYVHGLLALQACWRLRE